MGDRKARLAALAARAGRNQPVATNNNVSSDQDTNNRNEKINEIDASKPVISFRNYVPKDANLDKDANTSASDGGPSKRQKTAATSNLKNEEPKSALELALANTNREAREAAGHNVGEAGGWSKVTGISTKKVNWDLKRDIQQKMDRLERRTQKAIVELLRERLEQEARQDGGGGDSDLD